MKRVYDIVDMWRMVPVEGGVADLKMEVEFVDRGVLLTIRNLSGEILTQGGIDIPTLMGYARMEANGLTLPDALKNLKQQSAE